jgi:hypothetical protein
LLLRSRQGRLSGPHRPQQLADGSRQYGVQPLMGMNRDSATNLPVSLVLTIRGLSSPVSGCRSAAGRTS